jgi:hypothetical protein
VQYAQKNLKMKNILTIFICIFLIISCRKDKENDLKIEQTLNSNQSDSTKNKFVENSEFSENEIENQKKKVNHLSVANGGSILYLKNGDIKGQARFDTDGDFVLELLKTETYGKYKDYNNYLINQSGDTTTFFEENGKIGIDWKILKGVSVENNFQVVSFVSPKKNKENEIEIINTSKLIIFSPETKFFKDENSIEAENYFIAMDDWNFYSSELKNNFDKLKIETFYTKKQYLSFEIENGKKIILDTKSKINDYKVQCLLYKKGKTPIIVYLTSTEEDQDNIQSYLQN